LDQAEHQHWQPSFKKNKSIEKLDLGSNKIEYAGVNAITKALETNSTLTFLSLRHNQVGDTEASIIVNAVQKSRSVIGLDLSCNQFGDIGATALATMLTSNSMLSKLWLGYNCISKAGIDAIVNALVKNSYLKFLSVSGNALGDVGALALAKVIEKKNGTLQSLWLDDCQIGNVGAMALATALQRNDTLENISLWHNMFGEELWEAFENSFRCGYCVARIYFSVRQPHQMDDYGKENKKQLVQKAIKGDIPNPLLPQVLAYLSRNDENVTKMFIVLREKPELFKK
jgi:Ran GTPase-activating protein (RanGAP) involved in mRNA processing and transport